MAHAAPPRRPAARFSVLGNELAGDAGIEAHLSAAEYARDLLSLRREVDALWPTKPPLLLAPDTAFDAEWAKLFLSQLRAASKEGDGGGGGGAYGDGDGGRLPLDILSHHIYPLGAGDGRQMAASPRRRAGGASRDRSPPRAAAAGCSLTRPEEARLGGREAQGRDIAEV